MRKLEQVVVIARMGALGPIGGLDWIQQLEQIGLFLTVAVFVGILEQIGLFLTVAVFVGICPC
jgi:hypothetical protein